ncbi:MAG: biotin/lipoyl-binding protein [Ruminococcus sp.]
MKKLINSKKRTIAVIAVCFFSAVLILTFFSNTIQNASLPEITARYVSAGKVYERISGSGIAEADKTLNIYPECSGIIADISVRTGDTVKKGDLLCTIAPNDADSEASSKDAVSAFFTALRLYLQSSKAAEEAKSQLNADKQLLNTEIMTLYQQTSETSAQEKIAAFEAEKSALSGYTALANPEDFRKLPEKYQTYMEEPYTAKQNADNAAKQAEALYEDAQGRLTGSSEVQQEIADEAYIAMENAEKDYHTAYNAWQNSIGGDTEQELKTAADNAYTAYESCISAYDNAAKQLEKCIQRENDIYLTKQAVNKAYQERENAENALSLAADDTISAINRDICLIDILIAETESCEETLPCNADGTVSVYSETDGTVLSVNGTAGDEVMTSSPLMQLAHADSTYTVRFNVSAEKAYGLKTGTEAVVLNADASAMLKGMYNAAQSTSGRSDEKTLLFTVSGDVTAGQSLTIKLNESSQNYEFTVPSRAVSEDSGGTFILAVETQKTSLGTCYTARRIDIAVLADDGTTAAVEGELSRDTYIISTGTNMIRNGDRVRMKETVE